MARGHEVLGLARSAENERVLASLGGEPRRGDLFDVEALVNAARGADVVVRAATSIPRGLCTSAKDWAANDRIRRDGTKALTECAGRIRAKLYLQEGIVWVAQPVDASAFDEDARVRPRLWFASAADAESIAREAGGRLEFEVATLRWGSFYCADSAQTRLWARVSFARRFLCGQKVRGMVEHPRRRRGDRVRRGRGGGAWRPVARGRRPSRDDGRILPDARGPTWAPRPRAFPAWMASLVVGRRTVQFLTASTRTSNAKIRRDLGWSPRYPSCREGLRQVVDTWRSEGFPTDVR